MRAAALSPEALKVLGPLRERAMDGYTIRSRTKLNADQLLDALGELRSQDLVIIKGELTKERIGEAYVYMPPDALGYADMLLGKIR